MERRSDAWAVLGLDPGADRTAVRRAFRVLAKAAHPDHGGDHQGFQQLRDAFEQVLPLASSGAPPPSSAGANPYRDFLADLDRAAALEVPPPGQAAGRRRRGGPTEVPASALRFAAVLAEVLAA